MRDKIKRLTGLVAAAVLSVTAASFAGCSDNYSTNVPGSGIFEGEAASNGGFVVEKGDYIYFINGAESYTASNEYGDVVKGALMRISKSDLSKKAYDSAVTVVPVLFVAQNFDAGIYIYGDYVYYASPTIEPDLNGDIRNEHISFKRAKLDGSETMVDDYYFRSSDNAIQYRYVEVDGVVYCLHVDDEDSDTLYSYNTQTRKDTVLVSGAGSSFYFDSSDPESPYVYYTMAVTQNIDTEYSTSVGYTQVYSVRADAKVESVDSSNASYTVKDGKTYSFDADYLKNNLDGFDAKDYTTYPYVNLGSLVLDGRGSQSGYTDTKFTDDDPSKADAPDGYTYTIQSYQNGGLYYTRAGVGDTSSDGESTALYYLADKTVRDAAGGWKSIQGQARSADGLFGNIDTVALNTTNASTSAVFYFDDDNAHCYIYVSGSQIWRVKASEDGTVKAENKVLLAPSVSGVTLWKVEGDYLYYFGSGSNGNNITRINYKGEKSDYYPDPLAGDEAEEYKPTTILAVDWNNSWYKPEFIDNYLFFSNIQSFGDTQYNYIYVVDMNGEKGMMTTAELAALNEKYEEVTEYIDGLSNSDLKNALKYYFRTGERKYFDENRKEAVDAGKNEFYLYSENAIKEFDAFYNAAKSENKNGEDYSNKFGAVDGVKGDGYYGVESYFMNMIGKLKEEDAEAIETAWKKSLLMYTEEESDEGWATWQKVLLGVGIAAGVVVVAAAVAIPLVIRAKKKKAKAEEEAAIVEAGRRKPVIDTTDDKSIDVYADDSAAEAEPVEETAEPAAEEAAEENVAADEGEEAEPAGDEETEEKPEE